MNAQTAALTIETISHTQSCGWSTPKFPSLDSERTLVLVFGAPDYIDGPGPILDLVKAYPNSHIAGCSTSGEILGTELRDNSLSVAVVKFNHTKLAVATAPVRAVGDSQKAGDAIARQLEGPSLRGVLVLSVGLKVNGSSLVHGINSVLPESVVVTGGLAGDGANFKRTWVLRNGQPVDGFVSAIGFYGDRVRIGYGSKGGWDGFGPERRVTRSKGNVLYELDGKPALPLYKQYLGERAKDLPASALLFPLSLRSGKNDEKRLVRTILSVDEATQSLAFAGDIQQDYLAQLMSANFERLIDGAGQSALMTKTSQGPCLAVAISCVGRRLVLGQRAEEELESAVESLPQGVHQVGFYSYGELSPYASGKCDLHNQTMTLTTISEA